MALDLFEIELKENRNKQLKRIHFWATLLFIFATLTGLYNLYNGYRLFEFYLHLPDQGSRIIQIQSTAQVISMALYGVMIPLQSYFFYRFATHTSRAVLSGNKHEFYKSFHWLVKQAIVGTLLFSLNAAWAFISMMFNVNHP